MGMKKMRMRLIRMDFVNIQKINNIIRSNITSTSKRYQGIYKYKI